MRKVGVTELKNRLSHYLRLVKRGEAIEVVERSVPIARIVSLAAEPPEEDAHLARLEREGLLLPAKRRPSLDVLKHPPIPCGADPVQILIEERGDR